MVAQDTDGTAFLLEAVVQFSSVAQSCLTLCDPMKHSTPGLPVHHQLPESTQTHVHRVGDAIQPSHPLSSPSPPALNLSQHQGLFKWVSSLHQVAVVENLLNRLFQISWAVYIWLTSLFLHSQASNIAQVLMLSSVWFSLPSPDSIFKILLGLSGWSSITSLF